MLCGACWQETSSEIACSACGQPPLLSGRYRLDAKLGAGANGTTFAATRVSDGLRVCIKALAFAGVSSFEAEKLFHREATVLRQLRDPQVPDYVDDFAAGSGRTFALYLVQELVVGQDLAGERRERRPTVAEVVADVDELLGIVSRLHALAPPVIHRDIKPKNVMRRTDDGRLVLVDFGSVKDVVQSSVAAGASVQGTFGYMAPEQMRGEASPRSDLYAIGMLAIASLSGREPSSLIADDHVIRWHEHVAIDERLRAWLDRMTAPRPDDRYPDADTARRALAEATKPRPAKTAPAELEPAVATIETPREKKEAAGSAVAVLVVGAVALIGVAMWLLVAARVSDDGVPEPAEIVRAPDPCKGPCRPLSEPFKAKLRFGMTIEQARAARSDVGRAIQLTAMNLADAAIGGDELLQQVAHASWLPVFDRLGYQRLCMRSQMLNASAICCLDFAPRLERLTCRTDRGFDRHGLLSLIDEVERVYGNPSQWADSDPYGFSLNPQVWEQGDTLRADYDMVFDPDNPVTIAMTDPMRRLVLTQTSARLNVEIEAVRSQRRAEAERRHEAAEAERLRALEKIEEERRKLELPDDPL